VGAANAVNASAAIVQRLKRMEFITVRLRLQELTARPYLQSRMRTRTAASSDNDNAAFGVQPQGYRVAVRLAAKAGYRRF
jgi:hypothetical protein